MLVGKLRNRDTYVGGSEGDLSLDRKIRKGGFANEEMKEWNREDALDKKTWRTKILQNNANPKNLAKEEDEAKARVLDLRPYQKSHLSCIIVGNFGS